MTYQVADPHWIVRHVLQYGAEAEVLEPEEVRGWVRGVVGCRSDIFGANSDGIQNPRHLVTVWNPSYAQDAMDEHSHLLLTSPSASG